MRKSSLKLQYIVLVMFFNVISLYASAQGDILNIDSCVHWAKVNYPLIKQNETIDQLGINAVKSLNKNWLPRASLYSNATYQTEVTSFSIPHMANVFPTIPNNQFANALELEEIIFDAGQLKFQKQIEKLNTASDKYKNDVELYRLIDRVTQLYSGVLLNRANIKTLRLYKDNIANKQIVISSAVQNGVLLQSALDELEVEGLKTEQSIIEATETVHALYANLGKLINKKIDDSTKLSLDPIKGKGKGGDGINRPELKLFDAQKDLLEARNKYATALALPKFSFTGEGIYGLPGYNFLAVDPHLFGKVGVALHWNIGALYTLGNDKQKTKLNQQSLDVQKETFLFNLTSTLNEEEAQINGLTTILEKDNAIKTKRHAISLSAASQLENGTITTSDYLIQLNAEMQAILAQQIHEIKLMNALSTYAGTKGLLNY